MRSFHVDHVVQNRRSALSLSWHEWFSCKGKEWKIYCCELALSMKISRRRLAEHCTKKRAARAARNILINFLCIFITVCCVKASEGNDQWRLSDKLHRWTCVKCAIFLPRRRVKTRSTNPIQFFFWQFYHRFRKFGATRASKPFGNIRVNVTLLRNIHECVKSRGSCLKFCNFYGKLSWYVPLNNLIPNFVAFFVATGTTLSTISCTSSVDSCFFHPFFCRRKLASREKFYAKQHCHIHFHIRSNAGIIKRWSEAPSWL